MRLTAQQLADFDEQGYIFLPECFTAEEVALMRGEGEAILSSTRKEVWREKTGAPRTAFAAHTFNEVFRLLGAHPRLVEPLQQYFGEDVYVHQFKLNAKAAGVAKIDLGARGALVSFHDDRPPNIEGLLSYVARLEGVARLRPDSKLVITRAWNDPKSRLNGALQLSKGLAKAMG